MECKAITIRFPSNLIHQAKHLKEGGESFNDLVVEALEREVKRRQGMAAYQSIVARRTQVKERTGVHPNAAMLICGLREGEGRGE